MGGEWEGGGGGLSERRAGLQVGSSPQPAARSSPSLPSPRPHWKKSPLKMSCRPPAGAGFSRTARSCTSRT